ncbi:MAG: hypothetical protein LLG20_14130 [Acidobacteriales bacterium]|nr:hypothetical protein [Terriglobales bacterium]
MALYRLLLRDPLLACSVTLCLLAIAVAIRLIRRLKGGSERFIAGFVGLIAIYEGLKILMQAGIWMPANASGWTDIATFAVTAMFVLALVVIQELGSEGHRTKFLLRILEADPDRGLKIEGQSKVRMNLAGRATTPSTCSTTNIVVAGAARADSV